MADAVALGATDREVVQVRVLSPAPTADASRVRQTRLPHWGRTAHGADGLGKGSLYSTGIPPTSHKETVKTEIHDGDQSTIVLEVEFSAQELQQALDEGVRHLARRTRVPGFRPGKAPRALLERALGVDRSDPAAPNPIHDEAREHLYERSVLGAVQESGRDVLELPAAPEWTTFEEGIGAAYTVRLSVRPTVELGDYTDYPFEPQVDDVTDAQVDQVVEQLRDQQAALVPVEDRPAQADDFAVIRFEGRRGGEPVEGASAERFPLIIGRERMVPGFEEHLLGMREDEERTFSVTFPEDYGEEELRAAEVEFTARLLELRERRLPEADDDFAALVGPYEDMAALREDLRGRMTASALDRARHAFADRIIEYATANATVVVPDLMVDREVETMLDELQMRVAQQGIRYEDYLRVTERDEAALRREYREPAEHRVKVLLVLGAVADREAVEVPDTDVEAEVAHVREDGTASPGVRAYLDSERGRAYIRSQLRRAQVVEELVDRWIAAHPAFEAVQHQHVRHSHDDAGAPSAVDELIAADEDHDEHDEELAAIEQAAAEGAAR
jgi:trigger factor